MPPPAGSSSPDHGNGDQVSKFSAAAAQWWSPSGPHRPLLRMNRTRMAFFLKALLGLRGRSGSGAARPDPLRGIRILDVGCGGGIFAESAARLGADVTGIDLSGELIEVARERAASLPSGFPGRLSYLSAPFSPDLALQLSDGAGFDVISMLELLEHVDSPREVLRSACAPGVLRPGGGSALLISTLNRSPRAYVEAVLAAENVLGLVPKGTHQWERFLSPAEIAATLAQVDGVEERESSSSSSSPPSSSSQNSSRMQIAFAAGLKYDLVDERWSLDSDLSVNYIMLAAREEGGGGGGEEGSAKI